MRLRAGVGRAIALATIGTAVILSGVGGTAGTAAGPVLEKGDLILNSRLWGDLTWLRASGAVVKPLAPGFVSDGRFIGVSGADVDPKGRLWAVGIGVDRAVVFDRSGTATGTIVEDIQDWPGRATFDGNPTDISFDALGNALIGSFEFEGPIMRFDPTGATLGVLGRYEADNLDLASDQCTLLTLAANDGVITRKDICANGPATRVPIPAGVGDFSESIGMRILPDASVLVPVGSSSSPTGESSVIRQDLAGHVLRRYTSTGCAGREWRGIALSVDGTRFWSSCFDPTTGSLVPTEFDVATGVVRRALATPGIVQAVYGGFRAAQDRVAPTVAIATPADGATYALGESAPASYICADAGGSLLASCNGPAANGSPVDSSSLGAHSFRVEATDGAGNVTSATTSYSVVYGVSGLEQPLDNLPVVNVMRAGRGVIARFTIPGRPGRQVFASGYPLSRWVTCPTGAPEDDVEQTTNASAGTLTVDANGHYGYVFRTYPAQRNTCRELVLRFNDGTELSALFRLR
ncbi:MAG: PxKF domain-containing protein [Gaiellales bacterium]